MASVFKGTQFIPVRERNSQGFEDSVLYNIYRVNIGLRFHDSSQARKLKLNVDDQSRVCDNFRTDIEQLLFRNVVVHCRNETTCEDAY
jgi:hypothetical protein